MKTRKIRTGVIGAALVAVVSVGLVRGLSSPNQLLSDHPFLKGLMDKLIKHQEQVRPEKVYVQLDKTLYKPGESVWLSAYLRDAQTLRPSGMSDIVYVDFINPRGAVEKTITLIAKNGQAAGDFQLPANIKGGTYKIKAYTKWQENTEDFFEHDFQVQTVVLPNLNMKMDFERDAYGPGATASAQLTLETLDKQPLANHDFNFVLNLDGKEVKKGTGKTDAKGIATVSAALPADLKTNDGLLNVMFEYKGQTESISRSVPIVLGNIDLQFFPEGGDLVASLTCGVGFKAVDEFGQAADVEGEIVDNTGKKISSFRSYHQGMGKFEFRPETGKTYTARINQPASVKGTYQLPATKENAIALRVRGQSKSQIQLDVLASKDEELFVVAQNGGTIQYSKVVEGFAGVNSLTIPCSNFPVGITQITVFDSKKVARAERLVFVNQHRQLKIKVKTNKERYLPRELVQMELEVTNEMGRPVSGQFSVAVVDDKLLTFADDKQGHILAYTLLESDLQGDIKEPNFYFDDESDLKRFKPEVERRVALDNLLMTQGWRRFVWEDVQQDKIPVFAHKNERAIFAGKVTNSKGEGVEGAEVAVTGMASAKTDKEGMYVLEGIDMYQNVNVQVTHPNLYPTNRVLADYMQNLNFSLVGKRTIAGVVTDKNSKKPLAYASVQVYGGNQYITVQTNDKGEYKLECPENSVQLYVYSAGYNSYVNLQEKKGAVVNIEIDQSYAAYTETESLSNVKSSSTRSGAGGGRKAATTVDRRAMGNPGAIPVPVPPVNMAVNPSVNVPVDAVIAAGIVAEPDAAEMPIVAVEMDVKMDLGDDLGDWDIEDKEEEKLASGAKKKDMAMDRKKMAGEHKREVQKEANIGGMRYYRAREFYAPKYEDKIQPTTRTDFRSTVYWNPRVTVGNDGKASLTFYNSDDITQFRVTVEGFGNAGEIGRVEQKYFIQLPVELLTKIPAEVLTGDKLFIPITLTNNTDEVVTGQLVVALPGHIRLLQALPADVSLAAREGKTFFLQGEVTSEPVEGSLSISFNSKGLSDQMSTAVKARPRGFPVRALYSGDKMKDAFKMNINEPISGSVKAVVRVFPNTLDQVMGGMESMLRMPGGCFEQTSSSNYPNIMALNYMRETNSSNPKLEQQAREYLKVGYSRLTGYESKGGGFDWWGRDPAHEALTAYGLMQFIDMKSVYPVDEKLIERTTKWLMGRRDGNGSWNKNPNCLHSWATSEITDAYIVWSMTEAGLGKDISKEIDKSYKDAVKSEDPYLMALVINALYNVKDKRADELMRELIKTQKTDGSFMGLTASVVNSTGQSLMVETTALAALAMMKTSGYTAQMGKAVAAVQAGKNYYGYGSTQGTVLALKAIIGYTQKSKRAAEPGVLAVMVNGKKVISVSYTADQKEIVVPELTQYLATGEHKIEIAYEGTKTAMPYEVELTYNTRQPDNSAKCEMELLTKLPKNNAKMGETVRMTAEVKSKSQRDQPMTMAMIGIPAGLSVQMWQLKELQEKKVFDYYEIFNGYVVLHYESLKAGETRSVNFDLKADIPGEYEAPASCAFMYYTNEHRVWSKPERMTIN